MQVLPGFREFAPEDCARRNAITQTWSDVVRRYGFVEYDGPTLEPVDLYKKKSGGELVGQLFDFEDKGGRHVTLRPEMTPTVARMVAANERKYRKPLKWFSIARFFRYEKQQKGRLREFFQLNCDLIGDASPEADAELCSLVIDLFRAFSLTNDDFVLRLSDRNAWLDWIASKGVDPERAPDFLSIIDKLEREAPDQIAAKLAPFNITRDEVNAFIAQGANASERLKAVTQNLKDRGFDGYFEVDLTIVRGLNYYTGVVFEMFDRGKKSRALAGGGRFDNLIGTLSDGAVDLPAMGVGIGDVTLGDLIDTIPAAKAALDAKIKALGSIDLYVVLADESRRPEALRLATDLRGKGFRVEYALGSAKVGKQFQNAEQFGAPCAVVIGAEWPEVKLKTLATREEITIPADQVAERLKPANR